MNSTFIGYEELSRLWRVLFTLALASVDNTLLNLLNSSYPTQPHSLIANYKFNLMLYDYLYKMDTFPC